MTVLGPAALASMTGPALAAFLRGVQELTVWGRDADWLGARVDAYFPGTVALLKNVAAATTGDTLPTLPIVDDAP